MPAKIIFILFYSYILALYRTDTLETTTIHPDITQQHSFLKPFHKYREKCLKMPTFHVFIYLNGTINRHKRSKNITFIADHCNILAVRCIRLISDRHKL